MTANYAEIKRSIRYSRCLRHPDKRLEVGTNRETGEYAPLCVQCVREGFVGPALGRDEYIAEKEWRNVTSQVERYQGQPVLAKLDKEDIRKLLAPKAQDRELEVFLRYCLAEGMNPFAGDVWLVPFTNRTTGEVTHAIVIGLQFYLKKAARNPLYETYLAGCIVKRGTEYTDIVGTALYPGDELFGAWCKVWKRGAPVPFEHRVALVDWDKGRDLWKAHPNVMIEVTAIRQAIRRAFPGEFGPKEEPQEIEGVAVEVMEDATAQALAPRVPVRTALSTPGPVETGPTTSLRPASPAASAERRFHTPTEFWDATEKAGWSHEQVTATLGGSLGEWLSAKAKEWGRFATWDDAWKFLEKVLLKPEMV